MAMKFFKRQKPPENIDAAREAIQRDMQQRAAACDAEIQAAVDAACEKHHCVLQPIPDVIIDGRRPGWRSIPLEMQPKNGGP